jgi:D-sedoheptulose 7-phosphate isomerase
MDASKLTGQVLAAVDEHRETVEGLRDLAPQIATAAGAIAECLRFGGQVLLCGNGGSAADAQHLAAELVGRFLVERRAYPAIALSTNTSALTAIGNDYGFDDVFARQVEAHGREGDVLVAISTSGGSPNVLRAVEAAARIGMTTIGLCSPVGQLCQRVDIPLVVAANSTPRIQEGHILVGHILCGLVEEELCSETP